MLIGLALTSSATLKFFSAILKGLLTPDVTKICDVNINNILICNNVGTL